MCYNDGYSVSFLRTELQPPGGVVKAGAPLPTTEIPEDSLHACGLICVEAGQSPRETGSGRGQRKAATHASPPVLVVWAPALTPLYLEWPPR